MLLLVTQPDAHPVPVHYAIVASAGHKERCNNEIEKPQRRPQLFPLFSVEDLVPKRLFLGKYRLNDALAFFGSVGVICHPQPDLRWPVGQ